MLDDLNIDSYSLTSVVLFPTNDKAYTVRTLSEACKFGLAPPAAAPTLTKEPNLYLNIKK